MRTETEVRDLADQAYADMLAEGPAQTPEWMYFAGVVDALQWAADADLTRSQNFSDLLDRMRRAQADEAAAAGEPVDTSAVVIVSRTDLAAVLDRIDQPATLDTWAAHQKLEQSLRSNI
jgi:hypothetical protein